MQGMETDAASVRVEDRRGEEMIEVDQHRGQQDQPDLSPSIAEENPCDQPRSEEVESVMEDVVEQGLWVN